MLSTFRADSITIDTFVETLQRYQKVVPSKLNELDEQRYVTIPKTVAARGTEAYIRKDEMITLVEWKLSHGKFRPSLRGLALENAEEDVEGTTKEAFDNDDIETALKILTKLRGIGPATASLLLSVNNPSTVPFFSDELFRWCFYDDKPGGGWDRRIKYTLKEYRELVENVAVISRRLIGSGSSKISAVDIEKVAYVLGREDATIVSAGIDGVTAGKILNNTKKRRITSEIDARPMKNAKRAESDTGRRSSGKQA